MKLYLFLILLNGCALSQDTNIHSGQPGGTSDRPTIYSATLTQQPVPKRNWIHSEGRYSVSAGGSIKIYNSLPGGGAYRNAGEKDGYRNFCNSIVNESTAPLKIVLTLTGNSFPTLTAADAYLKALIPPDRMTLDKLELTDFGLANVTTLLDNGFKKPSSLVITLQPEKAYYFYTLFLFHKDQAAARSALVLRGRQLFYEVSLNGRPPITIPCGRVESLN